MRKTVSGLMAALVVVALTGCVNIYTQPTSVPGDAVASDGPSDGVGGAGREVSAKLITLEKCELSGPCVGAVLFAYEDCSAGAYVDVVGLDADGIVVASARGTLGSLPEGKTGRVEITVPDSAAQTYEAAQAGCL